MQGKFTYEGKEKLYGLAIPGTCNSGMTASTVTLVAGELAGYGNDYFNTHWYIQIIKNANSVGNAPESEIRAITDYASASGTFTCDAFSTNVQEKDEFYVLHSSIMLILSKLVTGAGLCQIVEKTITVNSDAGATTLATITDQPCIIESVVLRSNGTTTANYTNGPITGIAGVVTFLNAAQTAKALIDADGEQVGWVGSVKLDATETIVMTLAGGGSTAIDFTITIKYRACADGGYLMI